MEQRLSAKTSFEPYLNCRDRF